MKKIIQNSILLCISLLVAGVLTVAHAQRGGYGRYEYGGGYRRGGSYGSVGVYNRGSVGFYHNNYYGGGYRNVYRPSIVFRGGYSPFYGPRYYGGVPRGSLYLSFGGNPYYYSGGSFYRPFGGYYRSVFPPIGLQIAVLPTGCLPFYVGADPYYFYNGSYYRPYNNGYEVVDAPMGAQVYHLPDGAKSVFVNGEQFYELNGTYYKEDRDAKGNVVYTVVGKNGEINNSETQQNEQPSQPEIGDRTSQLPQNTKTITLNGETLYVTPDNTYYKMEGDGTYTVVGVAGSSNNRGNSTNSF